MLTSNQMRVAIGMYHSVGPMLEATINQRPLSETWEVVGADAFYHALSLATIEANKTGRSVRVAEYDQYHNYLKSEVIHPQQTTH